MVERLLTHHSDKNQDTRDGVNWSICNFGKYFLWFQMGVLFLNFQIRTTEVWYNWICLFILQTVVSKYFGENFVKLLPVCFVKRECALFLLNLFFLNLLFFFLIFFSIFLQVLFNHLFFWMFLSLWDLLIKKLDETSENDNQVWHVCRVSQKVLENYDHCLQ